MKLLVRFCTIPALFLAALWLAGCALQATSSSAPSTEAARPASGRVRGGQQPIAGAHVYLLALGEAGLGSATNSLLQGGAAGVVLDNNNRGYVTTASDGTFSVTGDYAACADPADQVYVVALGGNPGLAAGASNDAISLAAALGPCSGLSPSTFVQINELTTVAFTYAFAPYSTGIWTTGAPASLALGTSDAFSLASALVSTVSGAANSMAGNASVPIAALNTLGNALAACVNSPSSASSGCMVLTQVTSQTDTFSGALALAQHPLEGTTSLLNLGTAASPFQPSLTNAPADWTLALTISPKISSVTGVVELGDSITTLLAGNGANPPSMGYGQLVANTLGTPFNNGVGPNTNVYSQGGDQSIDAAYKAWIRGVPAESGNPPVTLMIGSNDVLFSDPNATASAYEQIYREMVMANMTLWLTPPSHKLIPYGNAACSGATWDFDGSLPGSMNGVGVYTSTVGAPFTCTYTSYGQPIFLWHLVDGVAGTASVTIDGQLCGTYSGTYTGYQGSYNGQRNTVSALRCVAPAGNHLVTITMLNVGHIGFEGLGTAPVSSLGVAAPPRMYTFGPLHQWSDGSGMATNLYAKLLENLTAQLAVDGYLAQYVNVRDHVTFTGSLDPDSSGAAGASCMANGIHPANCGHAQIAAAVLGVIPH